MKDVQNVRSVIFDFDDVLVETMELKGKAFAKLFEGYGEDIAQKVRAYHFSHLGLSRFDKFRYYYQELLHEPLSDKTLTRLSEQFQTAVFNEVVKAPWTAGALDCLHGLSQQMPLFVVSSVPHEEIQEVLTRRGVSRLFRGIFGSPEKKSTHIQQIMQEHKLQPSQLLFVGDALEDYQAAKQTGIHFVARRTDFNQAFMEKFQNADVPIVRDLQELMKMVSL